jgi:hypothetical protein
LKAAFNLATILREFHVDTPMGDWGVLIVLRRGWPPTGGFLSPAKARAQTREEKVKRGRSFNLVAVTLIVALVGSLGCGLLPIPAAEPGIDFAPRDEVIEDGECTYLEWEVQSPDDYAVFLDGERVGSSASQRVCPEETTMYELVVGAPGEPLEERVVVQVESGSGPAPTSAPPPSAPSPAQATATSPPPPAPAATSTPPPPAATPTPPPPAQPPSIAYFRANGAAGSITVNPDTTVTLSWEWQRVSEGYLDPGNTPMACPAMPCTYQVKPAASTTYTLRAVNAAGSDTETVTVNVTSPPPLTFTFSPTSGPPGSDVELSLSRPVEGVTVYFAGRVLPKRVSDGGSRLRVTIPGDATSGYFELKWDGQSATASQQFEVTSPSTTLILHNNTGVTIWYAYFSLSTEATWGDDRLGSDVVTPGATHTWTLDPGRYDLKAEDSGHNVLHTQWDANVVGTYHWYAQ